MALQSPVLLCHQADNRLHPIPLSCRGGFDFSLLFEEVILGVIPLAIIALILPWRIWRLFKKPRKVVPSVLLYAKLVSMRAHSIPFPNLQNTFTHQLRNSNSLHGSVWESCSSD